MGKRNSVHCESIKKFVKFLETINISKTIIKEILKFQYADGTLNGTGKHRLSTAEYKNENKESIDIINKELNRDYVIKSVVNRFIVQGTQHQTHKIDLLLYGTPDDFFFITPKEIHEYMQSKINVQSSTIHLANLTLQPLSRVLNYKENMEYMRNWIQIKWYNLEDNVIEIMNNRYL